MKAKYDPHKIPTDFHCKKCKGRCFKVKDGRRWCDNCNDYADISTK